MSKMVTVYEHSDFLSGRRNAYSIYRGSFFSMESAEAKLGWFYVANNCDVVKF